MILRRLTANFRRQDWTAVVVELVIVVLGVFIGLQAQDWATTQADQHRADVLLQQLRGDLADESFTVKQFLDYEQVTAAYTRTAIKGLESTGSVDPATWVASAYQASQILTTGSNHATFDEMKSTGAIDLIRNGKLRALLISYYSNDWSQSSTFKAQAPYRERVRGVLPYAIQKAIKAACGDRSEIVGVQIVTRLPKTCHLDVPAADIERAAESLRATPGLLSALTYQLSLTETNIQTVEATQQQLADLIAAAGEANAMILRRLTANFRRQDWSAVVIELVVVILGVFIGLQASNWNENRQTAARSADFTQRLRADLREEAWGYEMNIGYAEQVQTNARRAAGALTGRIPLSNEALLIAAYRATQFNNNTRRRATYDELVSTGEIDLIRDPALRDLAMRLYTDPVIDEITQDGQHSEYRKEFRMAIPYDVQLALSDKCGDRVVPPGDYEDIARVLDYPCATGLSPAAIEAADAILKADPRIVALLQLRIADIGTDLGNFTVYYANTIREPLRRLAEQKP